jgi:hypothetical protein
VVTGPGIAWGDGTWSRVVVCLMVVGLVLSAAPRVAAQSPPPTVLRIEPDPLPFGPQPVGTTSGPQSFVVTNEVDFTVQIVDVRIESGNTGDFALDSDETCAGAFLRQGQSCRQRLRFTPTAEGSRVAVVLFDLGPNFRDHTARTTGQGTIARAELSPDPVDFGTHPVGVASPTRTATLRSTGSGEVVVRSLEVSGAQAADFTVVTDECTGRRLPAGASCDVVLRFRPGDAGIRQALLAVTHSAPGSPSRVTLRGTGARPPDPEPSPTPTPTPTTPEQPGAPALTATPDPADFGVVVPGGAGAVVTVTVANTGTGATAISSVGISGPDAGAFTVDDDGCGGSLGPGATCAIQILLRPAAAGLPTAVLNVAGAGDAAVAVPLQGRAPVLEVDPPVARPGQVVSVVGRFLPPNQQLTVAFTTGVGSEAVRTGATGDLRHSMLVMHRGPSGPRDVVAAGLQVTGPAAGVPYQLAAPLLAVPGSAQPPSFVVRR